MKRDTSPACLENRHAPCYPATFSEEEFAMERNWTEQDWRKAYADRRCSADEALELVTSGMRVFIHGAGATPKLLVEALVRRGRGVENVEITHMHTHGEARYTDAEFAGRLRLNALFIGENVREAVNAGRADYIPVFLSEIPQLFRSGVLAIDVALVSVSPPDEHGYVSLGTSVDVALAAVHSATYVVACVNKQMPRSLGNSWVHVSKISRFVEADLPLYDAHTPVLGAVEMEIGRNVANLIDDGATLQMGIGAIPNAVLKALVNKSHLGVHTEMFSDGLVDLVEAGAVTGAGKTYHPHKIVSSFVNGTRRVYDFLDNNPMVEMHPVDWVNDGDVIRRNCKMTAINSAIEIDLTGQVVSDSIGRRLFSGIGGQMDFMRAAALSPNGKPIIALPSTAKDKSRIVPTLQPGAGVVTTRGHVHYVVTEYGVAYLHGKNLRQRAEALIAVAHPDHRAELRRSLTRTQV
jgi:acyl-CoA hydrolase